MSKNNQQPKSKPEQVKEKMITRRELYVMIKSFDKVKEPFSPLRRKLFSIFILNRSAFDEIEKYQKEYEEKFNEYNKKLYEILQEHADKNELGEIKEVVSSGKLSWTFTGENGSDGLKKLNALKKEYQKWLEYADPKSDFAIWMDEKIKVKYSEIEVYEVKKLSGDILVDSVHILPESLKEQDFNEKVDFEQIRIISKYVKIEM